MWRKHFLHSRLRNGESGGNTTHHASFSSLHLLLSFSLLFTSRPSLCVRTFGMHRRIFNAEPRATLHHRAWRRLNVIIRRDGGRGRRHEAATGWCVHDARLSFCSYRYPANPPLVAHTIGGPSKGTGSGHASIKIGGRCTPPPVLRCAPGQKD